MRPQLYIIRGPDGHPEAIHERRGEGKDKTFAWWTAGPDGQPTPSLQGRRAETLPLFGSQHVGKWDTSRPVYLVEGEKATVALATAGHRAFGTLGSSVTPGPGPLAVLIGLDVRLWPDADAPGRRHMQKIAAAIDSGVRSLAWVTWPDAPAGGDAADYLAAGMKVEELEIGPVPMPEPTPLRRSSRSDLPPPPRRSSRRGEVSPPWESPIARFNASVTVSDVLRRDFSLEARPGRAVKCPFHDDRNPSLSILKDDRRVFCHAGDCWANNDGRGRDAWDLAGQVRGLAL